MLGIIEKLRCTSPFYRWLCIALLIFAPNARLVTFAQSEDDKKEKKEEQLVLKPERKVSFTTDEGTWMSLDVSSDGQTIVFDLVGDLYTLSIGGGEAKKIVGDMSFEAQPKFSPDGKQILFTSDRNGGENLYACNPDGSGVKPMTKGRGDYIAMLVSPAWTPDGNYLIASRAERGLGAFHPYIWHKDGGTGVSIGPPPPPPIPNQTLATSTELNKMGIVASPDGKYFYWAQRTGPFTYNVQFPLWQIYRFNRETSETVRLTNAQGSAMRPVLSPDGKHLVYATRYQLQTALRVIDLETNEQRWLIGNVTRDDQESRATRDTFPGYAFMPDGKSLLVTIDGKIKRVDFANGAATTIPFSAKVDADIAARLHFDYKVDDGAMVKSRLIRQPVLSPDGKRIVFSAFNKIYVMDAAAGAKPKRLTNQTVGEFMPTWSPDGSYIAFATWTRNGGHLYRISSNTVGEQPEQLTIRAAHYSYPSYSPDGSKIAFTSGTVSDQLFADLRDDDSFRSAEQAALHGHPNAEITGVPPSGVRDLRYIPANGGAATLIASAEGARVPHFSNDAQRVFYTTNEGLSSVRLDGFDKRLHLKITGTGTKPQQATADEIRVSPDGTRAFVSLQTRHYLVEIPKAGKETVEVSITSAPTFSVPVKKLSSEGGDYLNWTRDGKAVTWSWGTKFYKQTIDAEKSESFEAVVEMPRAKPKGTLILTNARIITMKGDEVIERGDITVTDNRIVEIKPTLKGKAKTAYPADAKVIDVAGKTIIPGLVDAHAHMWIPRGVHQTQVWQYLANLAYGVTTTRDPQTSTTDIYAYADLVETGEIIGPRIFSTGPGVFSRDGLADKEAVRNFIKRYREAYRTDTLKQYITGDRLVRQWVALACREFKITPTTEGALDMKLDLSQMIDGFSGNEHALPIQPLYKDVVEFVAQTETFYTPTLLVAYGAPWSENYFLQNTDVINDKKLARFVPAELLNAMLRRRGQWFHPDEYGHKAIAAGAAKVIKAGGRVALGGHGQMQGIGPHWELWALQSGGMTTLEALRVATIFSAEAIGLDSDLGSIEPGKLADLLVLDQNPLTDIRHTNTIRWVMKNGELYHADTLDQEFPVQKKLDKQFWWESEPR